MLKNALLWRKEFGVGSLLLGAPELSDDVALGHRRLLRGDLLISGLRRGLGGQRLSQSWLLCCFPRLRDGIGRRKPFVDSFSVAAGSVSAGSPSGVSGLVSKAMVLGWVR